MTTTKDLRASWLTEVTELRINHFIYYTAPFSIMGGKLVGDQINPSCLMHLLHKKFLHTYHLPGPRPEARESSSNQAFLQWLFLSC